MNPIDIPGAFPDLDLLNPALGQRWLAYPSEAAWLHALEFGSELLRQLQLSEDDPRLVVNLRERGGIQRFAVIMGSQVICSLEWKSNEGCCVHRFQIPNASTPVPAPLKLCERFQPSFGTGRMVEVEADRHSIRPEWIADALEIGRAEWARVKGSPFRQHHQPMMQRILEDKTLHKVFVAYARSPLAVKMVEVYRRHLAVGDTEVEGEQWRTLRDFRNEWNLEVPDFREMRAVMKLGKLVHPTATTFWKILWEDAEAARRFFREVLDTQAPIEVRLDRAHAEGNRLLRAHRPDWRSASQDERTLSVLWSALDPGHHAPYKSSFYKDYCHRAGIQPAQVRRAYPHYLQLLGDFARTHIAPDAELVALYRRALGPLAKEEDPVHLLLAQCIWQRVLDQIWNTTPTSPAESDEADEPPQNPAPEPFLYHGEPFDPERFTGTYWILKAGEDARFWPTFQSDQIAAIGYDNWPDLREFESREAIAAGIPQREPTWSGNNYNHTLALWEFSRKMKEGDIIFAAVGRSSYLGVGIVMSDYVFVDEEELKHQVGMHWVRTGRWNVDPQSPLALKTLLNISQYDDLACAFWPRRILDQIFNNLPTDAPADALARPPWDHQDGNMARAEPDWAYLRDSFLEESTVRAILTALRVKKNVVLQGPPGTGKTFVAKRLARALMGGAYDDRIAVIQFHQSYSYEDFMQGFRPKEGGGFERRDGVFFRFCIRAQQQPAHDFFFVIDEINRGNLSKIFGELMMLIEADKRGTDHRIELTYSTEGERFYIPDNVHILGTMNTADRSLALVDYALRRRFAFFDLQPQFTLPNSDQSNPKLIDHFQNRLGISTEWTDRVIRRLTALNEAIRKDPNLGPGFEIGHSYFCHKPSEISEQAWYAHIVEFEVGPQLREFWFDNPDEAAHQIALLRKP